MQANKETLNEKELKRQEGNDTILGIFLVIVVICSICGLLRPFF